MSSDPLAELNSRNIADQYAELAARSESVPDKITAIDHDQMKALLELIVKFGRVMDAFKRLLYYDSPKVTMADVRFRLIDLEGLSRDLRRFLDYPPDQEQEEDEGDPFYQEAARFLHAVLGVGSELGELAEAMDEQYVHDADPAMVTTNVLEEVGDANWYLGILLHSRGLNMGDALVSNIRKLMVRYPRGFTPEDAEDRADKP